MNVINYSKIYKISKIAILLSYYQFHLSIHYSEDKRDYSHINFIFIWLIKNIFLLKLL